MDDWWACPECLSLNRRQVRRCYSCGRKRAHAVRVAPPTEETGVPPRVTADDSPADASLAQPSDEARPQGATASVGRWVDSHRRVLYAAAVVSLLPVFLVLVGIPARSALGVWLLGLATAGGVELYWLRGRSFRDDWRRLRPASATPPSSGAALSGKADGAPSRGLHLSPRTAPATGLPPDTHRRTVPLVMKRPATPTPQPPLRPTLPPPSQSRASSWLAGPEAPLTQEPPPRGLRPPQSWRRPGVAPPPVRRPTPGAPSAPVPTSAPRSPWPPPPSARPPDTIT
jgi:hypothetical protein